MKATVVIPATSGRCLACRLDWTAFKYNLSYLYTWRAFMIIIYEWNLYFWRSGMKMLPSDYTIHSSVLIDAFERGERSEKSSIARWSNI